MAAVPKGQPSPSSPPPSRPPSSRKTLSPRGRGSALPTNDPDNLLHLFAKNMRLLRHQRGLSQEAMADACSLDRTYISGIERNLRNLGIRNIQRIAEALKVDVRVLFDPELAAKLPGIVGR